MTSKPFTTCLWFDNQGEEAARYYVSIFNNSRLRGIHCYTSAGPGEEGAVMLAEFELNGQKVRRTQRPPAAHVQPGHLDRRRVRRPGRGRLPPRLADRRRAGDRLRLGSGHYGLHWQIVPSVFFDMISDPDTEKAARVTAAMLAMKKFDIAALQRAYAGD